MITLNVFFKVKSDREEQFLTLLNNMVTESNKESGCYFYQLWSNENNNNYYALIEHWEDKAALIVHQKTPHWIAFNNIVNTLLVEPYEEHHFEEIAR